MPNVHNQYNLAALIRKYEQALDVEGAAERKMNDFRENVESYQREMQNTIRRYKQFKKDGDEAQAAKAKQKISQLVGVVKKQKAYLFSATAEFNGLRKARLQAQYALRDAQREVNRVMGRPVRAPAFQPLEKTRRGR